MTPSPELHHLIHSLDKKEKAWFRSWCGSGAAGADYMLLFNAILRQKIYDEPALKQEFRGRSFLRRLPAVKNYLFEQILEALCALHQQSSPQASASAEILAVSLLIRKGMFHAARKRLNRLYPKLIEQELFLRALETISIQKQLLRHVEPPKMEAEMVGLLKREKELIEQHANLSAYQHLSDMFDLSRRRSLLPRTAKEEKVFRDLLKNPLLTSITHAKSFEARYFFHRINANCNLLLGQMDKTMFHRRKLAALFESLPSLTPLQISKFSGVLFDLAVAHRTCRNFDEALVINRQLMQLHAQYPQFRSENNKAVVFKRSAIVESDVLQCAGRFAEGVQRVNYWEKNLTRFRALIEKDTELILRYNIALLYYGDGKLRKALQWLNSIINEHEHDYVQDVVSFARIFRLFIHIDIGNDELIGSIARSTSNYLARRQRLFTTENLLLKFALELAKPLTREKQRLVYQQLLEKLEKLRRNRFEQAALEYFDCVSWLRAQLENRPFAEVYREQIR
ncbi:MAG: hypothetical protein MUC87_01600 [Bacteroidia bacterium]|jgi:hypothetical protein|nr:hypothetical protein [Bacteroidia bacterium]